MPDPMLLVSLALLALAIAGIVVAVVMGIRSGWGRDREHEWASHPQARSDETP